MSGFKKSNNIDKLNTSIDEKNNISTSSVETKKKESLSKNKETKVSDKHPLVNNEVSNNISNQETIEGISGEQLMKLMILKSESKDVQQKKIETLSLRVGEETYKKIKYLTQSGIISQSDLFTSLVEKYLNELEGDKR